MKWYHVVENMFITGIVVWLIATGHSPLWVLLFGLINTSKSR